MSHSFGEGYETRSDEEGFGGIYGSNQSLANEDEDKIVHGNSPQRNEIIATSCCWITYKSRYKWVASLFHTLEPSIVSYLSSLYYLASWSLGDRFSFIVPVFNAEKEIDLPETRGKDGRLYSGCYRYNDEAVGQLFRDDYRLAYVSAQRTV